jgi:hypothetical protein
MTASMISSCTRLGGTGTGRRFGGADNHCDAVETVGLAVAVLHPYLGLGVRGEIRNQFFFANLVDLEGQRWACRMGRGIRLGV